MNLLPVSSYKIIIILLLLLDLAFEALSVFICFSILFSRHDSPFVEKSVMMAICRNILTMRNIQNWFYFNPDGYQKSLKNGNMLIGSGYWETLNDFRAIKSMLICSVEQMVDKFNSIYDQKDIFDF